MQTVFVMVGVPGSGKSTRAKELAEKHQATIISSDKIRKMLFDNEDDQNHNDLVFKTYYEFFEECLKEGRNVILDATNIDMNVRKQIFLHIDELVRNHSIYREKVEVVAYVMSAPESLCVERDLRRARKVGQDIIRMYVCKFQFPQKVEGFDHVIVDEAVDAAPREMIAS